MASLEAFVLCFCALDHVDYARWFPIHNRHEYTLTGIQKIFQHCWALPKSHNTFVCIICIICDRTKNNDSIKTYCDAVALTDNFVFVRWLVGAREQVRILILTIKFDPKDTKKLPCLFPTN